MSPNAGGGMRGLSQWVQLCNSIFNLWCQTYIFVKTGSKPLLPIHLSANTELVAFSLPSLLIFLLSVFLGLFVSDFAKQTANIIFCIEK
jgi:hypothetical protein